MKIWSYPELAEKLPTLWALLERREDAHRRREAKKPVRKRTLSDPTSCAVRREIEKLLREIEDANKCQHCREIEELRDRVASLEDSLRGLT